MKKLELEQFGVQEMGAIELKQYEGGFVFFESSGIFYWAEMWGGVITHNDLKKIKTSTDFGLQKSTSYNDEYWKSLSQKHIPKLNKNIADLLGTVLTFSL